MLNNSFSWPNGKRAALSLTFDDARPSQIDRGLPILDAHDVKATFYVSMNNVEARPQDWRAAIANGHEIGNHTLNHPCSGNFAWSQVNALEDYTLERMEKELIDANAIIQEILGVMPTTFAYPCGQTYVGRGQHLHSYIPLVAQHFVAGRGFKAEACNDVVYCDLANLNGVDMDCASWEYLRDWIEKTVETGGWLVLAGHTVGADGYQTVVEETLDALCKYCRDPANGIWIDTVAKVGSHLRDLRNEL
jgi:peptidoglycan/xylan/chitin deacetylase (PgdA/CDA1 family)